jgi:hypothetical protein
MGSPSPHAFIDNQTVTSITGAKKTKNGVMNKRGIENNCFPRRCQVQGNPVIESNLFAGVINDKNIFPVN